MDHVAPACVAQGHAAVLENVRIARDTYRIRLGGGAMAAAIRPWQFVMIPAYAPISNRSASSPPWMAMIRATLFMIVLRG